MPKAALGEGGVAASPGDLDFDAQAGCLSVAGPIGLPWTGPAALTAHARGIDVVVNVDGQPQVERVTHEEAAQAGPTRVQTKLRAKPVWRVPCALAGTAAFCADKAGHIRLARPDKPVAEIATSRPGSPIAAALVGETPYVAFLHDERTSEGMMTRAFLARAGTPPVALSEPGSGATGVAIAQAGNRAIALITDTRRAMTPVHARWIQSKPKLDIGPDAVIFLAGGAMSPVSSAVVAAGKNKAVALVCGEQESRFGMLGANITDPPKVDRTVQFSRYPNGLDGAPIAALATSRGLFVARVRHHAPAFDAPHVLELGKIDENGAFSPIGTLSSVGSVSSVALASDAGGDLWIHTTDEGGSWVERLRCR